MDNLAQSLASLEVYSASDYNDIMSAQIRLCSWYMTNTHVKLIKSYLHWLAGVVSLSQSTTALLQLV